MVSHWKETRRKAIEKHLLCTFLRWEQHNKLVGLGREEHRDFHCVLQWMRFHVFASKCICKHLNNEHQTKIHWYIIRPYNKNENSIFIILTIVCFELVKQFLLLSLGQLLVLQLFT